MKIKIKKKLDEVSSMGGGAVAGFPKDDLKEMFSSSGLSGRNYIIRISGDKEHAGRVERAQHQGLQNVMEQDKTLELPDDSFVDTFGGDDMETLDVLSSAGDGLEDVHDIVKDQLAKRGVEIDEKTGAVGTGQYGTVYLGEYTDSGLDCAIKVVGLGRKTGGVPGSAIVREVTNYQKISNARSSDKAIWTHFPEAYDTWVYDDEDGLGYKLGFIIMEKLVPASEEQKIYIPDIYSIVARRHPMDIEDIGLHYGEKKDLSKRASYWARDLEYITTVFDMYDDLMKKNEPIDPSDQEEYEKIRNSVSQSALKRYERMADNDPEKIKKLLKNRRSNLAYWATNFEWLDASDILDRDLGQNSYIKLIWADLIYALARIGYFTETPEKEINQMIKEMSAEVINGYRKATGFPVSFGTGSELKGSDDKYGPSKDLYKAMQALYDKTGLLAKDVHDGNVMLRDGSNDLVIVDLGLFKQLSKPVKEARRYRIKMLTNPKK